MYKSTKLYLGIITALVAAIVTSSVSFGEEFDLDNISIFSPATKATKTYFLGVEGLTYPSFNNFLGNPNIEDNTYRINERHGDERKFLLGAYCGDIECPDPGYGEYQNTPNIDDNAIVVQKGDRIQFETYFHNNGKDPYGGDEGTSEHAKNVKIGVRALNKADSQNAEILRPEGYIYADNNSYRENFNNASTTMTINGQTIRTATDDMQIIRYTEDLTLKPVPGKAFLNMKTDAKPDAVAKYFSQYLTSPTSITFTNLEDPADQITSLKVTASPHYDTTAGDMWIGLDFLPGCFRYSGYAYFEAEVVGPEPKPETNMCKKLTINEPIKPILACSVSQHLAITNVKVTLENPTPVPPHQYITVVTSDANSSLKAKTPTQNTYQSIQQLPNTVAAPKYVVELGTTTEDKANGIYSVNIKYDGLHTISYYYSDKNGNQVQTITSLNGTVSIEPTESFDAELCFQSMQACEEKDDCKQITTTTPEKIYTGSWSVMSAKDAIGYNSPEWTDTFNYSVTPGYGEFYSSLQALQSDHPDVYQNLAIPVQQFNQVVQDYTDDTLDFMYNTIFQMPAAPLTFNNDSNYLQANVLLALNPVTEFAPLFPIPLLPLGTQIISAKDDDLVYFYAEKPGQKVITIQADNAQTLPCTKKFDILAAPTCKDPIEGVVTNAETKEEAPDCIEDTDVLKVNITKIPWILEDGTTVNIDPNGLPPHKITMDWSLETGSGQGQFSLQQSGPWTNTITDAVGPTVYFKGYGKIIGVVTSIDGFPAQTGCRFEYLVKQCEEPPKETCAKLEATFSDGTTQMTEGDNKNINFKITSNAGTDFPSIVRWINGTTGELLFPTDYTATHPLTIDSSGNYVTVYPEDNAATLSTPKPGTLKLEVVGSESVCNATLNVVPKGKTLCEDLNAVFEKTGTKTLPAGETSKIKLTFTPSVGLTGFETMQYGLKWSNLTDVSLQFPAHGTVPGTTVPKTGISTMSFPGSGEPTITAPTKGKIKIDLSGTSYSAEELAACQDELTIEEKEIPPVPVCKELQISTITFKEEGALTQVNPAAFTIEEAKLNTGEVGYDISTNVDFPLQEDVKVGYTVRTPATNIDYGCFAKGVEIPGYPLLSDSFWIPEADPATGKIICQHNLSDLSATDHVFFFPNKNLKAGAYQNVLVIDVQDTELPVCTKYISLIVTAKPVELLPCDKIELKSIPSPFEAKDLTQILIDTSDPTKTNFGDYHGDFLFEIDNGYLEQLGPDHTTVLTKAESLTLSLVSATSPLRGAYTIEAEPKPGFTTTVWVTALEGRTDLPSGDQTTCKAQLTYKKEPEIITRKPCEKLEIIEPTEPWYPNGSRDEFEIRAYPNPELYTYEWDEKSTYGSFSSKETFGTNGLTNTFINAQAEDTAIVSVTGEYASTACIDSIRASRRPISDEPITPKIIKKVRLGDTNNNYRKIINISSDDAEEGLEYQIKIEDLDDTGSIKIIDEGTSGRREWNPLDGSQDGELELDKDSVEITVEYNDETRDDTEDLDDFTECDREETDVCIDTPSAFEYEGIIEFKNLDKTVSDIEIKYSMIVDTVVDDKWCREEDADDGCGEEFENEVKLTAYTDNDLNNRLPSNEDSATVIVVCPYVLTRTGGDTFFNSDLDTGSDVAYCGKQKNIAGPVIVYVPTPIEKVASSGAEDSVARPQFLKPVTHDICRYSNVAEGNTDANEIDAYKNPLKNFSSTICESKSEVAEVWTKTNVVSQLKNNMSKITFWATDQNSIQTLTDVSCLMSSNGIYKWTNGLTIDGSTRTTTSELAYEITSAPTSKIPAGQTYIIEGADLHINSNIVYATSDGSQITLNPKEIPSAAFIVINGNIIIDKEVTELWGTYIAVDTGNTGTSGKILAGGIDKKTGIYLSNNVISKKQLTIYGSLIGDVLDLFSNRRFAGEIAKDEGSVTIKYIENLILNTPPGLSQLMDVSQLKVVK